MVAVEALDPTLRILLLALDPVSGARVPIMDVPIYNEILLSIFLVQEISSFDRTTLIPCLNPPHHPFLVRGASPLSSPIYLAVPVNQGTSMWQSRGLPLQGCEEQLLLSPRSYLSFERDSCRLPSRSRRATALKRTPATIYSAPDTSRRSSAGRAAHS